MVSPIPLRCQCGLITGQMTTLSSNGWNRFVCLCDDCQAYALWLGREQTILEEDGGTEIVPVTPDNLKILTGSENIRRMKFSEKGLDRWYAGCCKTPIGNTPNAGVPYVGVVHNFIYVEGSAKADLLGPVRGRIQGKFGKPPLKAGTSNKAPLSVIFAMIKFMIPAYLRGRKRPHPFYSDAGEPVAPAEILDLRLRDQLRDKTGTRLQLF